MKLTEWEVKCTNQLLNGKERKGVKNKIREKSEPFPIEIAMSNIMNVEEIRSVSRFGLSLVTVVFKESVPTLDARQLINEQIQTVAGEIPSQSAPGCS